MVDLDFLMAPGPTMTALSAPFWDAAAQGRLSLQHCEACGQHCFYPRPICPHCWSDRLVWKTVSGRGRLKSWTVVHKPGHPAWVPAAPYTLGVVELEEGPTLLTLLVNAAEAAPAADRAVRLKPTRVAGRLLPAFELVQQGSTP